MIASMQHIRLGLIGSSGRMGSALREHLGKAPDIELHATLEAGESVPLFLAQKPDAVLDLSLGKAVDSHALDIVTARIPYIIGATGYSSETVDGLRGLAEGLGAKVLIVPNFSLGASLLVRFASQAAKLMEYASITERHHAGKVDAPSGTARFTAQRIAAARTQSGAGQPSAAYHEHLPGVLGGIDAGVPIHSIRGTGYLAEQEVRFCLPGESLLLEHRSLDRTCFMPGILYAIRNINRVRGLQIGLDAILDV